MCALQYSECPEGYLQGVSNVYSCWSASDVAHITYYEHVLDYVVWFDCIPPFTREVDNFKEIQVWMYVDIAITDRYSQVHKHSIIYVSKKMYLTTRCDLLSP